MSFCFPCGLTAQQIIEGLGELAQAGLGVLGQQELAALVPTVETLADAIANLAEQPSPATVIQGELAAADTAADAAEAAKFPGTEPGTKP